MAFGVKHVGMYTNHDGLKVRRKTQVWFKELNTFSIPQIKNKYRYANSKSKIMEIDYSSPGEKAAGAWSSPLTSI
jgi:hypothetical protein